MAAQGITTGPGLNTVVGNDSMHFSVQPSCNIALGYRVMYSGEGSNNVIIGNDAGYNLTGISNVFVGESCGAELTNNFVTRNNVLIGPNAAFGMYTGSYNVVIGDAIGLNNYGVPPGYTMHSNIIIGINHTPKMRWNPVNKWTLEDSVGVRYSLWPTQSVNIGYPTMTPHTNWFGTNTYELASPPPTNIQFRLLVPSNVVIQSTNGAGFLSNTTVYGTTGDALVNVPFYTASPSTNAPAWNEFVTRNYVDTHSSTGGVAASLSLKTNMNPFLHRYAPKSALSNYRSGWCSAGWLAGRHCW